ncbi:MAG: type II secretion system protein GspC [Steroidobacterales bacterium]
MTDPRIQEWLSRLPRNGPWLASMVIASLIAIELARATVMLVGANQVKPVQSPPARPGAGLARAAINVQSIASAHLFGIAPPDSSSRDPANAPLTSANLVLAGTIATQDPKHGVAIIGDGGPSKVYSVGDNVSGATLHSVYLEHVILDRAGVLETLVLPRQLPPARPAITRSNAPPRAVENLRRMVQQDPAILTQVMRAVPSYDGNVGKLRGFRIYPGINRTAFANLGLRPGDLVTAINGATLDDPQRGQEIMNTIETADRATLTIERGGKSQELTLNVAQVAAEATNGIASAAGNSGAADGAAPAASPVPPGGPMNRFPGAGPGRRGGPMAPTGPAGPATPAPEPVVIPDDH